MVILASEAGTLSIPENRIVKKWRLQPGKMFLIDLEQGRIIDDAEIKLQLANSRPYRQWIERLQIKLESLPAPRQAHVATQSSVSLLDRQQAFGWTQEDYKFILEPMATTGEEVIGSMGNDAPLAVLSDRAKPFYNYFRQLFAQVTNPPIDPIREQLVMSLVSFIGPKPNLLDINNVNPPLRLEVSQPVLDFAAMAQIRDIEQVTGKKFRSYELDITYPAAWGRGHRGPRGRAVRARRGRGAKRLQHPDRVRPPGRRRARGHPRAAGDLGRAPAPDPRRPAHQRRPGGGNRLGPRSASLRAAGGYGAEAIHPYLALESLGKMSDPEKAVKNFVKAIGKGLNKVMSKMGISTYMSYTGAQIFEAVGLQKALVDKYFTGTASNIEGIGIFQVAEEALRQHRAAFGNDPVLANDLEAGGEYAYRVRGEEHMWTPDSIAKLQHASRQNNYRTYKEYAQIINDQSRRHMTLRGLFEFRFDPRAPFRWTTSSRPRRSSSASPPAPCRWARSRPKPTRCWPWP